jgi:hypothetical protein
VLRRLICIVAAVTDGSGDHCPLSATEIHTSSANGCSSTGVMRIVSTQALRLAGHLHMMRLLESR